MGWKEVREIFGFRAEDIAVDLEGLLVASDEDRHNGTVDCARGGGVKFEHVDTSHEKKKELRTSYHGWFVERERERKSSIISLRRNKVCV